MQIPKLLRQLFALLLLVAVAGTVWVFAAHPLIASIIERREELQAKRELLGRLRSAQSEAQQASHSPTAGIDLAAYFVPGNTDTERAANLQIAISDLAGQQGLRLRSSRILPPQPADEKIQTVGVEATANATLEQLTALFGAIAVYKPLMTVRSFRVMSTPSANSENKTNLLDVQIEILAVSGVRQ